MADFDSPFDTLAILAEVVSSDDEMLSLGKRKFLFTWYFGNLSLLYLYRTFPSHPSEFNSVSGDAEVEPRIVSKFVRTHNPYNTRVRYMYISLPLARSNQHFFGLLSLLIFLCWKISITLNIFSIPGTC
jgi:hypothetical protein